MTVMVTDHEAVRRWAEEHGARPACVKGTGDGKDPGIIRLDSPGYSGAESLQSIGWDEWVHKFDESGLALIAGDEGSAPNFNKLVRRDTRRTSAGDREHAADQDTEDEEEEEFEEDDDFEEDEEEEQEEEAEKGVG